MATYTPEDIDGMDFLCPACGWRGKGSEAVVETNTVVRCPHCSAMLVKDGESGR